MPGPGAVPGRRPAALNMSGHAVGHAEPDQEEGGEGDRGRARQQHQRERHGREHGAAAQQRDRARRGG